jgi:ABC-2 type transport system ATP-binding protein
MLLVRSEPTGGGEAVATPSGPGLARGAVIEARGLTKAFGATRAVDEVSFTVGRGEVFGFFGPNGAGKTTTIRLLCGLLPMTSGSATVAGVDVGRSPTEARRALAILPEEAVFYERMTPGTYLAFFAKMAGVSRRAARERLEGAARLAELGGFLDKPIANLSHGQRQKVSVARVLLVDAPVMFLDEPFTGIDIIHRKALREHLRRYVAEGNTVFFTSHNLIEAEAFVDRFAFIDKGRLVTTGTARELRDRYLLPTYALRVSDPVRAQQVLSRSLPLSECAVEGEELRVTLKNASDVPRMSELLGAAGISLLEMRQLGTMEEVFLRMREQGGAR